MTKSRTSQTPNTGFSVSIGGNAVGSAIGSNASVSANTIAGGNISYGAADEEKDLFKKILEQVDKRAQDPKVDKDEILEAVEAIVTETKTGRKPDETLIKRRLRAIARMAPDILDAIIDVTGIEWERGNPELLQIHQLLVQHFDEQEIKQICFTLHIDYDNLPGEGKTNKARELVLYFERRGSLQTLKSEIIHHRPNVLLQPKADLTLAKQSFSISPEVVKSLYDTALTVRNELLS